MAHPHYSPRIFSVLVIGLFVVFGGAGLAVASKNADANVLIAQVEDTANQQRFIKDQQNHIKDIRREVQEVRKESKPPVDTTTIDSIINKYESCIQSLNALIGTSDFWNSNQDCNSFSRDAEDMMQDTIRPLRNCTQFKRNIEERKKEKKSNIDRDIKGMKNVDLSAVKSVISQIDAQFAKYEPLAGGTCNQEVADTFNDIQNELNTLFQDAYSALNEVRDQSNRAQRLKQNQNDLKGNNQQCKDLGREFKNLEREYTKASAGEISDETKQGFETVKSSYTSMCDAASGALTKMKSAVDAGDVDAFDDARNEFNALQQDVWPTMNDVRNSINEKRQFAETLKNVTRDLQQKQKELSRMKKQTERIKKSYDKAAKKYLDVAERKQAITEFGEFIKQFDGLTTTIEQGLQAAQVEAKDDPDSYWYEKNDELNEMQNEFRELQNKAEMIKNLIPALTQQAKEIASLGRELENTKKDLSQKDLVPELEDILSQIRATFENAWKNVVSDPEKANELINDFNEFRQDWNEIRNDTYNGGPGVPMAPQTPTASPYSPTRPMSVPY